MKFVPGQYNEEVDVLLKWRRTEESRGTNRAKIGDEREHKGVGRELVVNVSEGLDDYMYNMLHSDQMGLGIIWACFTNKETRGWQQARVS